VKDRSTREPLAPYNGSSPEMARIKKYLQEHGLFLSQHWHTLLIIPPLIITEAQLSEGFSIIDQALEIADQAVVR
ncbi:MAG TPA: aspartate aminotransferase family protein, partial [Anaerolineales bacterium]|nr:aspartate aminotransferase family protein [Anaerolineales bacterium]